MRFSGFFILSFSLPVFLCSLLLSSFAQNGKENVTRLEVAWTWMSINEAIQKAHPNDTIYHDGNGPSALILPVTKD